MPPRSGLLPLALILAASIACGSKAPPPHAPEPAPPNAADDSQPAVEPGAPPSDAPTAEPASFSSSKDPLRLMAQMTDEICACPDIECIEQVQAKYMTLGEDDPQELTAEQLDQLERIGSRMMECVIQAAGMMEEID